MSFHIMDFMSVVCDNYCGIPTTHWNYPPVLQRATKIMLINIEYKIQHSHITYIVCQFLITCVHHGRFPAYTHMYKTHPLYYTTNKRQAYQYFKLYGMYISYLIIKLITLLQSIEIQEVKNCLHYQRYLQTIKYHRSKSSFYRSGNKIRGVSE